MRMRVVHGRCAMRGPARVGDACAALNAFGVHLGLQLGYARDAARSLERAIMHGHAAGVVTSVFQPLQALDQNGDDVAAGHRGDDSAHDMNSLEQWILGATG